MNTEQRFVFEVSPPAGGPSSETPVEQFARRRPDSAREVFRGVDLIPVERTYTARQSTTALAEVFTDPDRADEQDALVQARMSTADETYTEAFDQIRCAAVELAEISSLRGRQDVDQEALDLHLRVRVLQRERPELTTYTQALEAAEGG